MTTPFELVSATTVTATATKAELVRRTTELETSALHDPRSRVTATLQDARHVTGAVREVYAALAATGAQVTLAARGLQAWLAPGVRGIALADDDPLVDEWCLLLSGGAEPVAFTATDLRTPGAADHDRSFRWALTHDPVLVERCLDAVHQRAHQKVEPGPPLIGPTTSSSTQPP